MVPQGIDGGLWAPLSHLILIALFHTSQAVFPTSCSCKDQMLVASCINANLDVVPITLNPSFQHLVLKHNRELDLGGNRVSYLFASAFVGLPALRILQLDDNQLAAVPSAALAPLPALAELNLGLNALGPTIPDNSFSTLSRFSTLDLSGSRLTSISDGAFWDRLFIANNRLSTIPTHPLSALAQLKDISIEQNNFQELGAGAFQGLSNLRELDISSSRELQSVSQDAILENLNLESMTLNANQWLVHVGEGAFAGLPRLKRLSLRSNALVEIPRLLAVWSALLTVEVSENPLSCRCRVLWLREVRGMKAKHADADDGQQVGEALCYSPAQLRGRPLRSLSDKDIGCAVAWDPTQKQAVIGAICAVILAVIITLFVLLYRFQRRVQDALKDYRWNNRAISRKEHEYQKTFGDEDYVVRPQQHHNHILPPVSNHLHGPGSMPPGTHPIGGIAGPGFRPSGVVPPPPALKPIPVTEL
ncbi:hypothetical protein J437_LFUL013578 [Ladona fulva]|uniref:LRRCT domain-containing protein n=1 Tax=Ladona fulva TaxID=123851 RepID=A0A8K0KD73_LADFU|nr:hypothetical protein J437_LFUL013578 [Ladona fulva]